MMRDHGGFEGNAQTFRIVTQLEPYTEHHGMNLSRRTLLGLIKYPSLLSEVQAKSQSEPVKHQRQLRAKDWMPAKGIYDHDQALFNWVLKPLSSNDQQLLKQKRKLHTEPLEHNKTKYKSLDCSIMELADDIAYGVHDLEDAIVLGSVTKTQWVESAYPQLKEMAAPWICEHLDSITEMLFSGEQYRRKDAIGGIVNALLTSISIKRVDANFENVLLAYNAELEPSMDGTLDRLKHFVSEFVIQVPQVQIIEYKGQQIIMDMFEAFSADPERLLPLPIKSQWLQHQDDSKKMRVIADYVSSMTDDLAQKMHQQLFSAHSEF